MACVRSSAVAFRSNIKETEKEKKEKKPETSRENKIEKETKNHQT